MKTILYTLFLLLLAGNAFSQSATLKIGDTAPDITLPTADGHSFTLSSLKGRLVLIDFWATWCAPCVKEQPQLKALYEKFSNAVKEKRFEILGVSLDKNGEAWKKAIARLHIEWIQVSDLRFWKSVVAKDYCVEELPFNALVNEQGRIIALNLHGEPLEAFIQAQLNAAGHKQQQLN